MNYVFGPVASRRLGRSLGVDLVPLKTCSFDCTYCQLQRTDCLTVERREWVPLEDVLSEIAGKLDARPDYITLSGSGEPTLYARIGELIERLHAMTSIPVAVITNGSLLWQPEVRAGLRAADLLVPSLDAGDAETFARVNRPHGGITFERLVEGLIAMRSEARGEYWLEVLLLAGLTDNPAAVRKIAACARRIKPDRIQLNTATRPPVEHSARAAAAERLSELAQLFDPPAEVIAEFRAAEETGRPPVAAGGILELLCRRPCTLADMAAGLQLDSRDVEHALQPLLAAGAVEATELSGKTYYRCR